MPGQVRVPMKIDPQLQAAFLDEPALSPLEPALPASAFATPPPVAITPRPAAAATTTAAAGAVPAAAAAAAPAARRRRSGDDELLPRGSIIDKYCLDRVLGRGGFAVVYRATHLLLGTEVAIKLLRPRALARQPGLAALLCQEARFAARINHPNVVRVHDVTHNERITYVVMEYIDGRSLAETIRAEGALPAAEVLRLGLAVTAGLRVGLASGLIHRDIKPANILLPRQPGPGPGARAAEAKIVDLGLALGSGPGDQAPADTAGDRAMVVGTYGYMSPEQAADARKVDFRSDIYALGATLYEAATGSLPFPARDAAQWLHLVRHEPVPPPEGRLPGLPRPLGALLVAMLARRPEERPASYEALQAALQQALEALGPEAARPSGPGATKW
jgi:serine/threonine protein kinase